MKNMKRNVLLIPFVAVLALMVVGFASAVSFSIIEVEADGAVLTPSSNAGFIAGDVVPVRVWFESNEDQKNVEIEVEFKGYDETESVSQDFGYVEASTEYRSKIFNVKIPNDVDDASEETVLYVTVSSRDGEVRGAYKLKLQRESYELDVLAVDYTPKVSAGDVVPVAVVVENNGYGFAEDNFVIVSIPALGVSARGYIGDLDSNENYDKDNHEEDAVQKVVYLVIPQNAKTGVYEMEIAVYNDDTKTVVGNLIAIDGVKSAEEDDEVLEGEDSKTSTSVIALTVVLVVIFVVLLAVLVVLLTRKEKSVEEVETSYY